MDRNVPRGVKTVHGTWRCASSAGDVDLEAQAVAGAYGPFGLLVVPEPARVAPASVHAPHTSSTVTTAATTADAIGDFFGASHATHESRHDRRPSVGGSGEVLLSPSPPPLPPPYTDAALPAYSIDPDTEPATLAKYLFMYGFLFPPLWVLGAIILVSPLVAPAEFEQSKPGAEREWIMRVIRDAEVRWAWRCVQALGALLILACVVTLIVFVVLYG